MSLPMIAGFLVALGVLFVMMGAAQAKRAAKGDTRRRVPIPPESVQILALVCFIAGVSTLAYAYYTGNMH